MGFLGAAAGPIAGAASSSGGGGGQQGSTGSYGGMNFGQGPAPIQQAQGGGQGGMSSTPTSYQSPYGAMPGYAPQGDDWLLRIFQEMMTSSSNWRGTA